MKADIPEPSREDDAFLPDSLSVDRKEPGRAFRHGIQNAQRGFLSAFLSGVLFDREDLIGRDRRSGTPWGAEVLTAYEAGGIKAIAKLRESYAIALADGRKQRTYIARDPLGSHPLLLRSTIRRKRVAHGYGRLRAALLIEAVVNTVDDRAMRAFARC